MAERSPKFSVVTAAYNASETLGSAIQSVLQQTEQDLEMIVVDDGSADATSEVAEAFAGDGRVSVHRQDNAGPSAARNRGIAASRAPVVAFLDSDDMMMPEYLAQMHAALESDRRNGMAYTDGWSLDHATKKIHVASAMSGSENPDEPPRDRDALLALMINRNFMLSGAMVRREVLLEVGGYDESMRFAEDYDLWLRIIGAGYLAARGPGRLIVQRERADSLSKDEASMWSALRDLLARLAADPDVSPAIADAAREKSEFWGAQASAATGRSRARAALLRARRVAGRVKRLGRGRASFDEPPPEVAAAFPDLRNL